MRLPARGQDIPLFTRERPLRYTVLSVMIGSTRNWEKTSTVQAMMPMNLWVLHRIWEKCRHTEC